MRRGRKYDDPFDSRTLHRPSGGKRAVVKQRTWFENFSRSQSGNHRIVILYSSEKLVFVHGIHFQNGQSLILQSDVFR